MNERVLLFTFIILIVISEAIAQNYIKKSSVNGDLKYSGDSFSYNLINEPLGSGPDILFFKIS